MNNTLYNFIDLLSNPLELESNLNVILSRIEIPRIQRDYAQGRKHNGNESKINNVGNRFIDKIFTALVNNETLELDFVYGSINSKTFIPLDGQQRLTTLFLLHWYIVQRELDEHTKTETLKLLEKFTYETRSSSRLFCKKICSEYNLTFTKTPSDEICNLSWFSNSYKKDPTVNAMLNMIDEIHKRYEQNEKILYSNLQNLRFYILPLEKYELTEDLYIKMNARGKQLSNFENFKADFLGYINEQAEKDESYKEFLDFKDGFPIKLDTTWTDIFWKNKSSTHKIDEIYFSFINRFFFSECYINNSINGNADKKINYFQDEKTSYFDFSFYKELINQALLKKMQKCLDNYIDFTSVGGTIPDCSWDKASANSFIFIPQYKEDDEIQITTLTLVQRIVFFAVCKFFAEIEIKITQENKAILKKRFSEWLRVIWNLCSIKGFGGKLEIRNVESMSLAMQKIEKLNSQDIYNYLQNNKTIKDVKSAFDAQLNEEQQKAIKILESREKNTDFENKILEAENFAFFEGGIRFLFQNESGNVQWENFDTKFKNTKKYFDATGIKKEYKIQLIKSLVIQCDKWNEQLYEKQIFNSNKATWSWVLSNKNYQKTIHNILVCNELTEIKPTTQIDDELINQEYLPKIHNIPFMTIVEKYPDVRFRWWDNILALYKPKTRYDIFTFDNKEFNRNKLFSELIAKGKVCIKNKCVTENNVTFFLDWNIDFTYKEKYFSFVIENKVYAMTTNWNEQIKINDEDLFFDTKNCYNADEFLDKLDNLITKEINFHV